MKCLRCGKEVSEEATFCLDCGYEFEWKKPLYKKVKVENEPIVSEEHRTTVTDNPILTFILGLGSLFTSLLYITYPYFTYYFFIPSVVLIILTFMVSNKPSKINLIPVRNFGKTLAYVSTVLVLFKSVHLLLGILFFT